MPEIRLPEEYDVRAWAGRSWVNATKGKQKIWRRILSAYIVYIIQSKKVAFWISLFLYINRCQKRPQHKRAEMAFIPILSPSHVIINFISYTSLATKDMYSQRIRCWVRSLPSLSSGRELQGRFETYMMRANHHRSRSPEETNIGIWMENIL